MGARVSRISARTYLLAFSSALILPMFIMAAVALYYYERVERERLQKLAVQTARQVALILDAEVRNIMSSNEALAASSSLRNDNFLEFHTFARRYIGGRNAIVVLRTIDGKQLVNTQLDFGVQLPPAIPLDPAEVAVYRQGFPLVSQVYKSPISGEHRIAVAQLALPDQRPEYVLATTVPTTLFLHAVQPATPAGWIVGVADRKGTYLTHSARHDQVSGQPGFSPYMEKARGREGSFYANSAAGTPLLAGYYRSELTGWLVAANIPTAVLQKNLVSSLMWAAAGATAIVLLTIILAVWFSRKFGGAAYTLAERARGLSAGSLAPAGADVRNVDEFATIDDALMSASTAVKERAELNNDLSRALEDKDALLKEVNHRVKNSLQLVVSLLNLQRSKISDEAAKSAFDEAALRINTVAHVHRRLYRDDQVQKVPVAQFIRELCEELNSQGSGRNIRLEYSSNACFLPTSSLIPVAIILTELITNAFKHSFPEPQPDAVITVHCKSSDAAIEISVGDVGAHLPDDFEHLSQRGLGLKIIRALARQLDASIQIKRRTRGKVISLSIPATN